MTNLPNTQQHDEQYAQTGTVLIGCDQRCTWCDAEAGEPCYTYCVVDDQQPQEQISEPEITTVRCGNRQHEAGLSDEHHHHSVAQVRQCFMQGLVPSLEEELYEQYLAQWYVPSCSICDGAGHGYPGGMPCPLEVNELHAYESDLEERLLHL